MKNISFWERILGTSDTSYLFATVIFALIGVVISLLVHSTNRDKLKKDNPYKFSLSYLLIDNWKRLLLNILLILVTIRFSKEITGIPINEFVALLIGISYDKLSEFLQNKNVLIGKK